MEVAMAEQEAVHACALREATAKHASELDVARNHARCARDAESRALQDLAQHTAAAAIREEELETAIAQAQSELASARAGVQRY